MDEVEDIMCDQCIISSDFTVMSLEVKKSYLIVPVSKLWFTIDLLARALLPSVTTVYYSVLRNPQTVVESVKNQLFPALVAFLANSISRSLASVQRISFPVNLRAIKDETQTEEETSETEKSVECLVLHEPEEIFADVIFIHGIHGGVDKTWKQGTWRHDGHKLKHQSPIRRQSTGNMYVPPRQQSLKRTLADIYSKIPNKVARKEEEEACIIESDNEWEVIEEVPEDNQEESEGYSLCWPRDWIPKDCPNARVIALNYSTDILWYPIWAKKRSRTDLVVRSQEMIEELVKLGVGQKPIIWVGHSKGGLYIKQILVNAWETNNHRPEVLDIFWQTKSIMWYSVPHKGSILADISLPILKRSIELLEIQRNCDFVLDLHKRFLQIIEASKLNPEIFSFIETSFTLMSVVYLKIISYDSADPKIGVKCDVPLDHREICKPAGRDCFLYTELTKLISRCLENDTS